MSKYGGLGAPWRHRRARTQANHHICRHTTLVSAENPSCLVVLSILPVEIGQAGAQPMKRASGRSVSSPLSKSCRQTAGRHLVRWGLGETIEDGGLNAKREGLGQREGARRKGRKKKGCTAALQLSRGQPRRSVHIPTSTCPIPLVVLSLLASCLLANGALRARKLGPLVSLAYFAGRAGLIGRDR